MKHGINLVTIWTEDIGKMKAFYNQTMGMAVVADYGSYVEFANEGVRFAVCQRNVMYPYIDEYRKRAEGQVLELAFECDTEEDLDATYIWLTENGATPVSPPKTMPWNHRTAFIADPDGNIHEIFFKLPE